MVSSCLVCLSVVSAMAVVVFVVWVELSHMMSSCLVCLSMASAMAVVVFVYVLSCHT